MTTNELEFLPAALEIQDTPPLPAGRYILWAIMLLFSFAVVWATLGQVDIVGVAQGKIVPSSRVKVIQPLETGVVRTIYVNEGDHVEKGQALIELDSTQTGADREQIREQQLALKLDRARLLTILDTLKKRPVTHNQGQLTHDKFTDLTEATPAQISRQRGRAQSQLNEYHARMDVLKDEKRQRRADRGGILQRIAQLNATIPLVTERANALKGLLEKDLAPRSRWLELEQQRIEQVKERDVQKKNLMSIEAAMANISQRQAAQKAGFETQILTDLAGVQDRITALEQELIKAEKRITLQSLRAPVAGTVHQLAVHTIGGIVTPAQELMHIVPEEDAIEVEAWIANRDIGFVHNGQEAEIKVETFPFTKYGTIDAELINVSNDATPDEHLGLVYAARVKMRATTMKVKDKIVNLTPGMAVTVEVKMGKRRLIEYLTAPLLRYKDESVHER